LPRSTTHSAEFVMAHAAEPTDLTKQQSELWASISKKPIDVQTVFNDQTLDRALVRLTQRGIVLRAGFTPTDASHLVGELNEWDAEAVDTHLSEQIAGNSRFLNGLDSSQRTLLADLLVDGDHDELKLQLAMQFPIIGLGAPALSYYPKTAQWLQTNAILPEHGNVANALGAVVGSVRQQHEIVITPAGGKSVSVHFNSGTRVYDDLENAADAAIDAATTQAKLLAQDAGAKNIVVEHQRVDNIVDKDGDIGLFRYVDIRNSPFCYFGGEVERF